MNDSIPIETEVKFLIEMPNIDLLLSQPQVSVKNMTQTYLLAPKNTTLRVRRICENGKTSYIQTQKKRISLLSSFEEEKEISEEEYKVALLSSDLSRAPIQKVRYSFPYADHTMEIDVYPFWNDRAILEIELANERDEFSIPDFICVIKNVTDDNRYKNVNLAQSPIFDDIGKK